MEEDQKHFKLFGMTFPVHTKLIIQLTILIWILMLLILFVGQTFFQYEMTNADLPMGAIAGFLLAYLISIIVR